jgi:uncharacterized membrane protein YtjA (UPF0391 family)
MGITGPGRHCAGRALPLLKENPTVLRLVIVFLVIAVIAGFFGYVGAGSYAWEGARTFFFLFLVLALVTFYFGGGFGRWST